jgi:hypothetical protein
MRSVVAESARKTGFNSSKFSTFFVPIFFAFVQMLPAENKCVCKLGSLASRVKYVETWVSDDF